MRAWSLLALLLPTAAAAFEPLPLAGAALPSTDDDLVDVDPIVIDGPEANEGWVWNGTRTQGSQHREVVSLFIGAYNRGRWVGDSFCSGSLIHPEWVLTAAHCLDDIESQIGGGVSAWIAWGNSWPGDKQVAWAGYVVHPDYNPRAGAGAGADIGLVRLAEPVYDEPLMPISVARPDASWVGLPVRGVGFGITRDRANDGGDKRFAELFFIRLQGDLHVLYDGSVSIDQRTGYAYESSWDSSTNLCNGDSGGASIAQDENGDWVQIGVNAITINGCVEGSAGSTRIDRHVDFLEDHVPFDDLDDPGNLPSADPAADAYTLDPFPQGTLEAERDLGDPPSPADVGVGVSGGDVPVAACGTVPGGAAAWWLGLVALGAMRRRYDGPSK